MSSKSDRRAGGIRRPFLTRLARDRAGNTLAIVGAALIPLTAMIGSGVDMSRAYMAKSRLQNACDAAALAGRRVMTNDTVNQTVIDEARRFFNFNFQQGLYQTSAFTPAVTRSGVGTVRVAATTNIPTSIMGIFGISGIPLSVECDATLNFVNTDVMLVLDVTGSMNDTLDGTQKIVALRDAVMALYDTLAPVQAQLQAAGLRLRYGVVPYSSTVNVGHLLRAVDQSYLASDGQVETLMLNFNTPVYVPQPGTPEPAVTQVYGSSISQSDCDLYGRNLAFSGFSPSATTGGGPAPQPTWSRSFSNNEASGVDWGWSGAPDTNGGSRSCRRRYIETDTTYATEYRYTNSSFEGESIDLRSYNAGGSIRVANDSNGGVPSNNLTNARMAQPNSYDLRELADNGTNVTTRNVTWNGCIEERETLNTITTATGYTIPTGAFDLDINLIPHNEATRWQAMLPQIAYRRAHGEGSQGSGTFVGNNTACPAEARRLATWTRTAMQNYINSLTPTGSTYHDIGMIWGTRMLSTGGVFADGCETFNGMPCTRHIIFMTDAMMDTDNGTYSAYGIERNSQRISGMPNPSEAELNGRHEQRFRMVCNTARSMNASIWVIAFGAGVSPAMQDCASNANQVSTAANRQQLIDRFAQIGQNIGALRLTQ
jgi:Flp pilus assembly protein TadG